MLDAATLYLSALGLAKECQKASRRMDLDQLICNADALKAVSRELDRLEEDEPVIDWKEVSRQIYNAHPGVEKSDADRLADDAFDFAEHLNRVRSGGAL
jgi:hypothetical protein